MSTSVSDYFGWTLLAALMVGLFLHLLAVYQRRRLRQAKRVMKKKKRPHGGRKRGTKR